MQSYMDAPLVEVSLVSHATGSGWLQRCSSLFGTLRSTHYHSSLSVTDSVLPKVGRA